MLTHPDFNKRNIFVSVEDPTVVTNFIDWQSTSIDPAFCSATTMPDFAEHDGAKLFIVGTRLYSPVLAKARRLDESLRRPFDYVHRTWNDGAVALRHDLILMSQEWMKLGLEGSCPVSLPDPHQIVTHEIDYQLFVAAQNLRREITTHLDIAPDGWVPTGEWESKKSEHDALYQAVLHSILQSEVLDQDEPIQSEDDLRSIWPFDLRIRMQ